MSREHSIPTSGEALHRFVDKHLRTATAFYLGNEAADAVLKGLGPIVSLAQKLGVDGSRKITRRGDTTKKMGRDRQHSGVSPAGSTPLDSETDKYPTVQPLGAVLPMVLVASRSADRCRQIDENLEGAAAVQQVDDVVSFLDNLQATSSLSPLVIIDCVEASVQPATLATLAHELPKDSAVLLWGATEEHHRDLTDLASRDQGWLRCGVEASPSDVAALIHMLLGE